MRNLLNKVSRSLAIIITVFGPATITAISDNDAAGVATYSLAGAKFGYSILFVLLLVTFLLAITQEIGVRTGIVTGKGLGDLIREQYGIIIATIVFILLFIANMGTIIANFAALKTVAKIFSFPPALLMLGVILLGYLFVSRGDYHTNQRIFLVGVILYFSYIISAFKAKPDWLLALKQTFIPLNIKVNKEFIIAGIAVLGTTITPWGQFFIQSYVNDKKIQLRHLKYSQLESYFGAFLTDFFSFFMIVATTATLFVNGISIASGEEAILAIKPFAGELAGVLFGVGLLNAAVMGIVIVALSTAYAFSEFFGIEGSLDAPFEKGKLFYGMFLLQLVIAGLFVLLPWVSLFKIVFYTQSLNGILLPVIFYFLLNITNNKELMREHINKKWYNYVAILASIVIVAASLFAIFAYAFKI